MNDKEIAKYIDEIDKYIKPLKILALNVLLIKR